jgi:D-3-phosphoglycerate dehydrogenase
MARVLICDPVDEAALEAIRNGGHEVVEKTGMSPEELMENAPQFDALVVRSATKVRKPVLEKAAKGNLKLIVRGGVGLDNIDVDVATDLGITVNNTPAASSVAVAELAMAHMLACSRFLGPANLTMKRGEWNKKAYGKGKELSGSTLGLIGFGRISCELAKIARGFGMKIIFFDPYIEGADDAQKVELETLLKQSDFISLHIPHNKETHYLLDAPQFDMMKDGVVIVNCARGGTVNEEALLQAIQSGKVFGAGVDVFEEEPPKENPLVENERVLVTPHIGAGTGAAKKRVGSEVARKINEFFA